MNWRQLADKKDKNCFKNEEIFKPKHILHSYKLLFSYPTFKAISSRNTVRPHGTLSLCAGKM